MAYTALETMRKENRRRFRADVGPWQPPLYTNRRQRSDLKSAALRLIHNSCEGLCFDEEIAARERQSGVYEGKSLRKGQIPYNMEMDLNRLCLEKALENFIDSGVAEDAYAVYYCYLEIFFGPYGQSKRMVELLSEYETNGSSLLMKHRDHYAHSVYVFALGLAIYETNSAVRRAFKSYFGLDTSEDNADAVHRAANLFLEYWGLTALFHDIGYPFELPFEQVLSYFEADRQERGKGSLYLAYHDVEALTGLDADAQERFAALYGRRFATLTELLAFTLTRQLGAAYALEEAALLDVIDRKPTRPNDFGYYMDHAFFSAARLYRELARSLGPENLNERHVDALSAILLHNSLYKFSIAFYKDPEKHKGPLPIELHPLAWLLMLCDELQCWDRTAYGRRSRTELHPMAVRFDFSDGRITALYVYDQEEQDSVEDYRLRYEAWRKDPLGGKEPRLKAYSDMAGERPRFVEDIEKIVDTSICPLTVAACLAPADRENKRTYLSGSSFLHLYDFAVALHGRSLPTDSSPEELEAYFTSMSLEYQLSTLNRARHFARYLDAIRCFYTDRPVDYEPVTRFTARDAAIFAPLEHERWVREHQAMGWRYGRSYETLPLRMGGKQEKTARLALREQLRCHKLAMDGSLSSDMVAAHYRKLSETDQDKDWRPFNKLLVLLKKFDGLRIYRL